MSHAPSTQSMRLIRVEKIPLVPSGGSDSSVTRNIRAYEATSTTPRVADWEQINYGPNAALDDATLARARSQDAIRNNPWIAHGVRLLVSYTIGCGIQLHPLMDDQGLMKEVIDLWGYWGHEADADGSLHFNGWQTLLEGARIGDGEVFVRLRPRLPEDGLIVPLQVQALEAELIPQRYNDTNGNNLIRQGIERTPFGKRAAYWSYPDHPGDRYITLGTDALRRIPAESILHYYQPDRPGQLRGVPKTMSALYRARNLDLYEAAELTRKRNKSRFNGAIWKESPEENPLTNTPANPVLVALQTELAKTEAELAKQNPKNPELEAKAAQYREKIIEEQQRKSFVDVEDGYMLQLASHERVELFGGDTGNSGALDFMRTHLRAIAAGMNVPVELMTGDYSGTNDRIMRVILNGFYRALEIAQDRLIHQILQPIYCAWLDAVFINKIIKIPNYFEQRRALQRAEWRAHAWNYANPLQEAQTAVLKIKHGLTSRRAVVAESGWDVEEIDRQQAEDHAREEQLGLHYGDSPDPLPEPPPPRPMESPT